MIYPHFHKINLTDDQNNAIDKIHSFFNSDDNVFILQGYAGSGKTTLIKGIISYLKEIGKTFEVIGSNRKGSKNSQR